MKIVLLTALGVGGATVFGAVMGFVFRGLTHKFRDVSLAFAAGVMLSASILGLILPAVEHGLLLPLAGFFSGAAFMTVLDRLIPHLHALAGVDALTEEDSSHIDRVLLFIAAIALHNFPEGIAAGVSFGSDCPEEALMIAGGIALQNIPEGMVIIAPMLAAGIKPGRTFLCGLLSGLVEVVGTFLGYFAISAAGAVLPFALTFAGGTMLYVISDEMIPDTHAHGSERAATYALLVGFCVMLVLNALL